MVNNVESTVTLTGPNREQVQRKADRGRERYLKLVQGLRASKGRGSARYLSLRRSQAMMEQYQHIMRMIVRPTDTAGSGNED